MQSRTDNYAPAAFGRRRGAHSFTAIGPKPPGKTFVVHYGRRMNWLAVVLLITAFTYALDLIEPSDTNLSPLTNFDQAVMWFGTLLTGVIGIGWLWQGLCRAPALTMTNTE